MKYYLRLFLVFYTLQVGAQGIIKHVAHPQNTQGHITTLNSRFTNGLPDRILIVTQNYGAYNNNEIGVWYNNGRWKIFNQNRSPIPENARFNVLVLPPGTGQAFVHTTGRSNINNHITTINSAITNAKPNALLYITQRYGQYNTSNVGVWYHERRWKIYNENISQKMPSGAQFNVLVLQKGQNTINNSEFFGFTYSNTSTGHISVMPSPIPIAREATLFATQNWSDTYNPKVTGVWFDGSHWTVYNQNRGTLPKGTRFNIMAVNFRKVSMAEEPVLIAAPPPAPVANLPRSVTLQNFNTKFALNQTERNWLDGHVATKSQMLNFYSAHQTANGREFTELALQSLMEGRHVNFEEAFIEITTSDGEYNMEGTEDFIPYPLILSSQDTVQIQFGITTSDDVHANQKVSLFLIDGLKFGVEKANNNLLEEDKIKSLYIMATTNGQHGTNSNHYIGAAADISRINDEKMALSGVTYQVIQLQNAFDGYQYIRENFGPAMKHKYMLENDGWDYEYDVAGHTTHIHFSVRK